MLLSGSRLIVCTLSVVFVEFAAASVCQDPDGAKNDVKHHLAESYGVHSLNIVFDVNSACTQDKSSPVGFVKGAEEAIDSFFYDATDPDSPLALMIHFIHERHGWEAGDESPERVKQLAKEALRDAMNAAESVLRLWRPTDPRVEWGESVDRYWIWHLRLPGFSDHGFWGFVDKLGEELSYNYGVN